MLSPFAAKANHWPLYFQTQCSDGMFCSVQTGPPTGAWRGRVLAFVERNELLGFPAFHSQCSRATERLARRLCGSLGGAALVNTDVVASATQPADAGPVPRATERPMAIAGATQSSEERIRTTEEQRAEVDGMRDFRRCHRQVCIVATLPGTGVTADFKVEKSRSRYLGGKILWCMACR